MSMHELCEWNKLQELINLSSQQGGGRN